MEKAGSAGFVLMSQFVVLPKGELEGHSQLGPLCRLLLPGCQARGHSREPRQRQHAEQQRGQQGAVQGPSRGDKTHHRSEEN